MEARVAARDLYEDFVRTFGNVLFAVCLFLVWGVLTLIGVVVQQNQDPRAYFDAYAAPVARAIVRLGFDNIYHSYWYVGIIGLILLSLAVCTFKRVIPARLPPLRPLKIDKIPLNAQIALPVPPADARARVDAFFRKRGWQVRERTFDGTEWVFADKFNWARRGVLIAHLGFVIIAAGASIYWARGFAGETAIVTGQSMEIPRTHALIRLDRFDYKIQPIATKSGMVYQPIDYVSHVTVTGNDGKVSTRTIRVNQPIDIDGTLYYQASYGFAMRFDVLHDGKRVAALSDRTLMEGEGLDIPGTQKSVQYERFVPTVDRVTGQPGPDPRINDPAAVLGVYNAGVSVGAALVPLQTWIDLGGGWRIVPHTYLPYTGLQYRYDPGAVLVGVGAFVLLAGLVISFYFLPARLYVRVEDAGDGTSAVGVAATTVKGYDIYERQFGDLTTALKGDL